MNFKTQVFIRHCTCTRPKKFQYWSNHMTLYLYSSRSRSTFIRSSSFACNSFVFRLIIFSISCMAINPIAFDFRSKPEIVSEGICRLLLDAPWLSGCLLHHCCGPAKLLNSLFWILTDQLQFLSYGSTVLGHIKSSLFFAFIIFQSLLIRVSDHSGRVP